LKAETPTDIDGYISQFAADVQAVLKKVREAIRSPVPDAKEIISYLIPAFKPHDSLVYLAA
jgi:uncharacterized protein YdhG (YjbR/CyaY superfamily)